MNPTEKKLFQALTTHEQKVIGALFTTFNFDPEYFEDTFLPALLEIDMEDEIESTLKTLDIVHALELIPITILLDARANLNCHRKLPNYELIPIWDTTQHSKISCIIFEKSIKLVISSANLNADGIHKNKEVYVELVLQDEDDDWKILEDVITFLKKMKDANQLSDLTPLTLLEQKFIELRPPSYGPTNLEFIPVSPTGDKINIPTTFKNFWARNEMDGRVKPEIIAVYIQSPFFETSATEDRNLLLTLREEIQSQLKQRDFNEYQIYLPSHEGKLVTLIPREAYKSIDEAYFYENETIVKDFRFPHLKTYLFTDHTHYSMYLLGSSNFSPSAFGYTSRKKPNWEANIAFFKKDHLKKDISLFFPKQEPLDNLGEIEMNPMDMLTGEEELLNPIVIRAEYENSVLRIETLNGVPEGYKVLLDHQDLTVEFKEKQFEQVIDRLTVSLLVVMKGEEVFQSFPISVRDLSFDEHIKMIPQDMIIRFIEARYKYNRDIRPSEVILEERSMARALAQDLKIDTSSYLLYQIREFNQTMSNLYLRLRDASPHLNQVQYHLNGKFGIHLWICKYLEDTHDPKLKVIKTYQALEAMTQALLAFENCSNVECLEELEVFYSKTNKSISELNLGETLNPQMEIYRASLEILKNKIFKKEAA